MQSTISHSLFHCIPLFTIFRRGGDHDGEWIILVHLVACSRIH
ncbi:hypothetical protein NC651_039354 [Populus alba x Populus x berolinensis]|nr:hypothetical protein NC651_039354 [Populus alba x Populus x berolinensis]